MFSKMFIDHPASVNETYSQHFLHSMKFSMKLFKAGIACFIHALVPAACVTTGSRAITELHHEMVLFRIKNETKKPKNWPKDDSIEYMI
jgi:hypothetical protein